MSTAGTQVGEVVTVRFLYADLSSAKNRPALVLARMNEEEFLLLPITSQPVIAKNGVRLVQADFEAGGLRLNSQVRFDRPLTAHRDILIKQVGKVRPEYLQDVLKKFVALLNLE